jgi:RimJ/RimL family protein N-acetyltransferase
MDRDPAVTRFIVGPWADPVTHRALVEARIHAAYPTGMGYWSVFASDRFVGWILLTPLGMTSYPPVELRDPEIEIGWRFVRAAWGRGYATEAARPVLNHALGTLKLSQVVADIDPANTASIGVARKLGFRVLGPIKKISGRIVDRYVVGPEGGDA